MIVAFVGRAGSGKDTAAGMLAEHLTAQGTRVRTASLAAPLKRICADLFGQAYGIPDRHFYGSQEEKAERLSDYGLDVSGREILQRVGTDGFRDVAPGLWIRRLLLNLYKDATTLITDCRFPNEAEAIQRRGGLVVRLWRGDSSKDHHRSETEMDKIVPDVEIDNRAMTLDELREAVCCLPLS